MRVRTAAAAIGALLALGSGLEVLNHGPLYRLDGKVALNYWPIHMTATTDFGRFLDRIGKPELACVVVGLLAVIMAVLRRRPALAAAAAVGLGTVGVATLVLKHIFPRTSVLGHLPGSFPSGHTGVAVVAVGLILILVLPPARWHDVAVLVIAGIWGAIMAWGRLITEAHWLSDVIAGWGIGLFASALALKTADLPLSIRGSDRSAPADR